VPRGGGGVIFGADPKPPEALVRKLLILAVPLVLLTFSGTDAFGQKKATTDEAAVRAAVDSITAVFVATMNAGKFGDVAVLYAEDAMVLPAESPAVKGRAAIKTYWEGLAAVKATDLKLTLEELEVHGDVAIEYGTYSFNLTPPGAAAAVADNGKYIVVWKRQSDGSWQMHRDMFSTNIPRQ
jgi:uncharacterized protein (TIGR02246 family)